MIAVQVFEDCDCAVGLFARRPCELYFARGHFIVVTPEIVGVQKKEDSSAGLVADTTRLLGRCCPGQKQARTLGAGGAISTQRLSSLKRVSSITLKLSVRVKNARASS